MFQTLKAQNRALGDLEYVVQSSVPASEKAKATRKLPACTRCKIKKVRQASLAWLMIPIEYNAVKMYNRSGQLREMYGRGRDVLIPWHRRT